MSSAHSLTETRVEKKKEKKVKKQKESEAEVEVEVENAQLKKEKKHKKTKSTDCVDEKKEKKKKSKRKHESDSDADGSVRKKEKKAKKEKAKHAVPQETTTVTEKQTVDVEVTLELKSDEQKAEVKAEDAAQAVVTETATTTTETSVTEIETTIETTETKPTPKKKKTLDTLPDLTEIPGETSEQRLLRLLDDPNEDEENKNKIGRFLAIDCEMVGVGPKGTRSVLARVSIVNFYGRVLMDKFVKPTERVTDYRTFVSGIKPNHVRSAPPFAKVQKEVAELINNRVIVGHSIHHDLDALQLEHPAELIRDTSLYHHYRAIVDGHTPGLKRLAKEIFNLEIQGGSHSSVTDAQATMLLFRKWKKTWDRQIKRQNNSLKKAAERKTN